MINNIIRLIDKFHNLNQMVILSKVWIKDPSKTSMTKLWPNEGIANSKGAEIIDQLKYKKFDKIIKKVNYSAFFETDLDSYFKENRIEELYITGINTGCCILFSGVDAFYRGYDTYLVKDANSTSGGKKAYEVGIKKFEMLCGNLIAKEELLKK